MYATVIFDRSLVRANNEILGGVNRPEGGYLVIGREGTLYRIDSDGNPDTTLKIKGPAGGQQSSGVSLVAFTTPSTERILVAGNPDLSPGDLVLFELSTEGIVLNTLQHTEERGSLICSAIAANNESIVVGGMRYYPPSFPATGKPWIAAFDRNGTTLWEKTLETCPGSVASVVEVPGTGWDSVIRTTGCDGKENGTMHYRDIRFDWNGQTMEEHEIVFPEDPSFTDSQVFIVHSSLPATLDKVPGTMESKFVLTRFVKRPGATAELLIRETGRLGTTTWTATVPWSSWSGDQSNEIDAVTRTGDGSVIVLGKSYRW